MSEKRKIDGSKWAGTRKGVACPQCQCRVSHVYRTVNGESRISRERQCLNCEKTWVTVEMNLQASDK